MTRFALILEYDGGPFMGLQRQAHGPSVQQAVEQAVFAATGETVAMHSAGRTDAGVHAVAMSSHIDITRDIAPFRLMGALNAHLRPAPIAVKDCRIVPEDWHARFSCTGRSYLLPDRQPPRAPDAGARTGLAGGAAARCRCDAQCRSGAGRHTRFHHVPLRPVSGAKSGQDARPDRGAARQESLGSEHILIETAARSFLHHQVRSMVGCLALVGMGRWPPERLAEALAARDRQALGLNAPPEGLYFVAATY